MIVLAEYAIRVQFSPRRRQESLWKCVDLVDQYVHLFVHRENKKITDPAALFFLGRKRKPPFHQVSVESTPLTASHRFGPFRRFGNSP